MENKVQVAPKINANKFPFNSSIVFQTTSTVSAPNNAGKNFTQNMELPKDWITHAIQEVKGVLINSPRPNGFPGPGVNIHPGASRNTD